MKKWTSSTSILFLAFIFYFNAVVWFITGKKAMVCVWFLCATVELIIGLYYRRKEKKQLEEEQQEQVCWCCVMRFEKEIVNSQKLYSIGYCSRLDKYILSEVVTWVAWYNRYYEITEDEYNFYGTYEFEELVASIRKEGTASSRFLFSDKKEENNPEQDYLRNNLHKSIGIIKVETCSHFYP